MKKIISIVLGVAALAACTKTSVSYEQPGEIALAPVTRANMTKAAITGTTFPTTNDMGVYAFYNTSKDANTSKTDFLVDLDLSKALYLDNVRFMKKNDTWAGANDQGAATPYYWPKTGSLVFAAYSPKGADLAYDATNDSFSTKPNTNYVQETDLSKTVDLLWSPMTTESHANGQVAMVFYHAMSWVTVQVKAANDESINKFRVKSIALNNIINEGSFITNGTGIDWTPSAADAKTLSVFSNAKSEDSHVVSSKTEAVLENVERGTVVIPQNLENLGANAKLTVVFSQMMPTGNWSADQNLTFVLNECKVGGESLNSWANGKHYIYTLSFNIKGGEGTGDNEILIAPSLKDWDNVTAGSINAQ